MKKNKISEIKEWIEKADHDLGTAKITFNHIPEYRDTICFHCQQAIEKYLKGYLILLDIKFKFSHDLLYLLDLIYQKDNSMKEYETLASKVQNYSIEVRYPGSKIVLEEFSVKDAIESAEKFRGIIINKINLNS